MRNWIDLAEAMYPGWTLASAQAWVEENTALIGRFGFRPEIVGGVLHKEGERKDVDILLHPVAGMLFEDAMEKAFKLGSALGGSHVMGPLEAGEVADCWFIGYVLLDQRYFELYLDEKHYSNMVADTTEIE